MERPAETEFAPAYGRYVQLVEETDIVRTLEIQGEEVTAMLERLDPNRWTYRYAPEKWTVGQLVRHITDGERVFAYRALTFAREDDAVLPGFDESTWAASAGTGGAAADAIAELDSLRRANVGLFRTFTPEVWPRTGVASGNRITVRAIAYVMAGHIRHHLGILRERYGV